MRADESPDLESAIERPRPEPFICTWPIWPMCGLTLMLLVLSPEARMDSCVNSVRPNQACRRTPASCSSRVPITLRRPRLQAQRACKHVAKRCDVVFQGLYCLKDHQCVQLHHALVEGFLSTANSTQRAHRDISSRARESLRDFLCWFASNRVATPSSSGCLCCSFCFGLAATRAKHAACIAYRRFGPTI